MPKFVRGFTLIELLVVVSILGVLAAAIVIAINPAKRNKQARDATRKSDIGQIANALHAYYTNFNGYPVGLTSLTASGDLKQIPTDPLGASYNYTVSGLGPDDEAAVSITIEDPTSGSGNWVWCFKSAQFSIGEVTTGSCVP